MNLSFLHLIVKNNSKDDIQFAESKNLLHRTMLSRNRVTLAPART